MRKQVDTKKEINIADTLISNIHLAYISPDCFCVFDPYLK